VKWLDSPPVSRALQAEYPGYSIRPISFRRQGSIVYFDNSVNCISGDIMISTGEGHYHARPTAVQLDLFETF